MWTCKHCKQEFEDNTLNWKANHSRWCDSNPKKAAYKTNMQKAREAKTAEGRKRAADKLKKLHADGVYSHVDRKNFLGKTHSPETIERIREKALASNHRRLKKGIVEYNGVMLDSSWELALAKTLDKNNIKWVRPDPVKWTDESGIQHNYFPDFYLLDYDIYLDPKNPMAYNVQSSKISSLKQQMKNLFFLKTLEECVNFDIAHYVK
jgi:hypothetical protein